MADLSAYKRFYFIGIGGIGMSALARYFRTSGYPVAGYDKTASDLTRELEAEGIAIHFEDNIDDIPAAFREDKDTTLVIYTPAVPKNHTELNYLQEQSFTLRKRAQVLADLTEGKTAIAVAGTHGKTSTSAIITHILKTANVPFFAFLGGIASNYKTNFIAPADGKAELIVVEADEFDRSFLQLKPDIAIVTAVESDHLDIYGTFEELKRSYQQFCEQVEPKGKLILNEDVPLHGRANVNTVQYGIDPLLPVRAENIRVQNRRFYFDAQVEGLEMPDLSLGIPGRHNIENSLAAISAVKKFVSDPKIYYTALETFRGVHRRFEVVLDNEHITLIDDYAHHPTEISATISTVRQLYPGEKILGIFQPHLFSRTKDLADGFAESLSALDEVILLPIYPAREEPVPGVSSELILEKISGPRKSVVPKEKLLPAVAESGARVVVTIGAGDIDRLVEPLRAMLAEGKKV